MKKIAVLAIVFISGISLFSCTEESTADTDTLYDVRASDGEDGQVEQDPDAS